ncbi:amino acid adenylation domain-containing protein [Pseudomonas gessardii]|uniref:Amino acid adenylation domain-containing protein n=1 Tax=Pseudomonas gessardii TaxID=78544 RepID=A0A7Y1MNM5_9PSED|nr:amino acid adenylation domain-containing protein [Pseudomonas gessardii]NNA95555.1 amino acid adenylation domain-containing protein [Pseudomonas gessardii]
MSLDTVVGLFCAQRLSDPQRLAVVGQQECITYAELDSRSSKVADWLQSRNVGVGDLILVRAERSVEFVVALLGVLKTGAAFVPMDRHLPRARQEYIAAQCLASCVLATNSEDDGPLLSCEVTTVTQLLAAPISPASPPHIKSSDAMYVIFTSGTTGNPKGVVIEHHSVVELMRQHNRDLQIDSSSRQTLMAAVGFDLCQAEIWSALIAGACLYLLDEQSLLNSQAFLEFCAINAITHAFVPTLKVYDILSAAQPVGLSLNYIYTCGEKLYPVDVDHLPYRLVDCYGPTEATIFVTSRVVESRRLNRPSSIGFPIGSCQVYIVDENFIERPTGEVGELCIAGTCLAREYLRAPELTAERFVYVEHLGCRVYRSGDQAKRLDDGSIQFLGRKDGQVKIRGYRVEVGEVEARLLQEPGVNSAAVVVQDSGSQAQKRLVAFVVKLNQHVHSEQVIASLRRSLEADLPDYMLPEKYYCLDALPANANGKTDKQALLALLDAQPAASFDGARFADELERALGRVWFELLEHDDFQPHHSFFEVGGHSLRAAALARRLTETFLVKVSVHDIYQHLVFADQVTEIRRRKYSAVSGEEGVTARGFEEDVWLLSGSHINANFDATQLTQSRHMLLTGATGFVGVHLLEQLLLTSNAHIHCPVRCETPCTGLARLQQIAERYQIVLNEQAWSRVRVYVSDLSQPMLGMDQGHYYLLVKEVDLVYHSASAVNFIMPYDYMKKDNVEGMRQVIQFCATDKTKPLMLMSTISIYSWGHRFTGRARAYEQDDIDQNLDAIRKDLGYVQSKWVMEKLADLAASQGLPVATFRLGYATCHSVTGVCANYQWWGRFIQTCLTHNAVPDLHNMREGLTTVDYMVRAIAFISRKPEAMGKKLNLCQTDSTNLDLKEFCRRVGNYYGRELPVVAFKTWVGLWENNQKEPLYPLLGLFKDDMHGGESILELYQNNYDWDRQQVQALLKGSDIQESEFNAVVLATYLKQLGWQNTL